MLKLLLSVEMFKVHGRMITGDVAKAELGLNVELIAKDDPYWHKIWSHFVHADTLLSRVGKMVETRNETLVKPTIEVIP